MVTKGVNMQVFNVFFTFTMFYDAMIFWVVSKVLLCSFLGMLGGLPRC